MVSPAVTFGLGPNFKLQWKITDVEPEFRITITLECLFFSFYLIVFHLPPWFPCHLLLWLNLCYIYITISFVMIPFLPVVFQGDRMDDQRASLPAFPGLRSGSSLLRDNNTTGTLSTSVAVHSTRPVSSNFTPGAPARGSVGSSGASDGLPEPVLASAWPHALRSTTSASEAADRIPTRTRELDDEFLEMILRLQVHLSVVFFGFIVYHVIDACLLPGYKAVVENTAMNLLPISCNGVSK